MTWLEVLPLLLKLVGFFLDRSSAANETKAQYYSFLQSIIADESSSAKLRESAMSQREKILAQMDKQNG